MTAEARLFDPAVEGAAIRAHGGPRLISVVVPVVERADDLALHVQQREDAQLVDQRAGPATQASA